VNGLVIGHETTVDYNGDERDPAWRAYCETGHWAGSWQHADDYLREFAPDPDARERATEQSRLDALDAAEQDARDHRDIHTND